MGYIDDAVDTFQTQIKEYNVTIRGVEDKQTALISEASVKGCIVEKDQNGEPFIREVGYKQTECNVLAKKFIPLGVQHAGLVAQKQQLKKDFEGMLRTFGYDQLSAQEAANKALSNANNASEVDAISAKLKANLPYIIAFFAFVAVVIFLYLKFGKK